MDETYFKCKVSWDCFSWWKFDNYFIPTTDKVKTHRKCCCHQRDGSLVNIQNEFSYVASVMNSLHGLFYLRKESQRLTQSNEFTLLKLNCWETKVWQHFPKTQLQYYKLNRLLFCRLLYGHCAIFKPKSMF